jgi:electron transfer flavoprotein beta subunit
VKIGVCLKQVPASDSRIKINGDSNGIVTDDIKWEINPYDEYALEAAIQMVQAKVAKGLVIIGLGDKDAEARIKDGVARAVKAKPTAVRVEVGSADALGVGRLVAAAAQKEGIDLLLTGKMTIDDDDSQVPAVAAEVLGWAQISQVDALSVDGTTVTANRVMGGGNVDVVSAELPAVVTCEKGLNTPRFASLPGIMKAKRTKIAVHTAASLGVDGLDAVTTVGGYAAPPARPSGRIIEGPDLESKVKELVRLLREEAKVV